MKENIKEDLKEDILNIKDLKVHFNTLDGRVIHAVNGVNLTVSSKETLAIVGESGSGKTQLALSIMDLLPKNAKVSGEILFEGKNLLTLSKQELNDIRGIKISMVFQDPMTSLNPYLKVSKQLTEVLVDKQGMRYQEAKDKAVKLLEAFSIPEAEKRIDLYPHQFSGGMRQRIMIAMALLSNPRLLIADEPTTALDVTIQAQILDILQILKTEVGVAIIIITHDLGVVSNIADKIAVFYAGNVVEYGTTEEIFSNPRHPYTQALLKSMPRLDQDRRERLFLIKGTPPLMLEEPKSCMFKDRCMFTMEKCCKVLPYPIAVSKTHRFSCFLGEIK
ncbi:putative oligopeptide transport ATP-binding protein OppD [Candidatus Hepatincolaceae symbiont of Richtersius coronifer]